MEAGKEHQRPNKISAVRKAAGLSQGKLAEALGVHWVTISKLERGEMKLTAEWMEKIARALRVDPSALLWKTELLGGLQIIGELSANSMALDFEGFGHPNIVPLSTSFLGNTRTAWAKVADESLQPHFSAGDLLQLHLVESSFERLVGRLVYLQTEDEVHFGRLAQGTEDHWDIFLVSGQVIRHLKVLRLAVLTAALFQYRFDDSQTG